MAGQSVGAPLFPARHDQARYAWGHRPCKRGEVVCQAVRRALLIKRRKKLPAKQRRRDKYQDVGRPVPALPGTSEFDGRITTAINSANGPIQLLSIMSQHGEYVNAQHVTVMMARLAGFAMAGNLTDKQAHALQHCGQECIKALKRGIQGTSPLDLARALYSMYRLKLYDEVVTCTAVDESFRRMSSFQPDALSGLGVALGGLGHRPSAVWLNRYCLETYIRIPRFTSQDIANVMFGLAKIGHMPSTAWLEKAQRRLRDIIPVAGTNAPALVKIAWALATFQARPSFNWLLYFTGEMRQRMDLFTGRELATIAWAWARLSYTPDPLFAEAWQQAITRRLPTINTPSLLLALRSAALWGLNTQLPGKMLAALLPHTKALLRDMGGPDLAQLIWSMVNLKVRPDESWMDDYSAVSEAKIHELGPGDLADCVWAFARLRYQPSEEWEQAALKQVSSCMAKFTPAQLGVLIWAWRNVELDLPPHWEQVFMAAAPHVYTSDQIKDVTKLLGILAEQNVSGTNRT